ncbi:MAG: 2-polyprenyl-3-methyl-5-hydroxy-6-metoxy-1,4-benzoquinol methylase [Candidatus Omnitrophota bacterium]|jgi:2-polyprenyl-3-methyl-5-hydroxy-6-metoxy-1,4-benzoquinol methylase
MKKVKSTTRYPAYLPGVYRFLLKIRKMIRQGVIRKEEENTRKNGSTTIKPDGAAAWADNIDGLANNDTYINKSAKWADEDLLKPHVSAFDQKIKDLQSELNNRELRYCSAAGTFVRETYHGAADRKKNWENCWILAHANVQPEHKVLDIGGASTIFAFFVASIGCEVHVIDNDWGNCGTLFNTNYVGRKMGWNINAHDRDIQKTLPFPDNYFDRIFSICVVEHLPSVLRQYMMKEINRVSKPGCLVGLTTDYDFDREVLVVDKGLRFAYPEKLYNDIIDPSGLKIYGNTDLVDAFKPNEFFLGSLFLEKAV